MPYIKLETNVAVSDEQAGRLLSRLSAAVTGPTGKPEKAMQATVQGGIPMMMGGSTEPTAYLAVQAINFPADKAGAVSREACAAVADILGIAGTRIYVAFDSYQGAMWGVDGHTFA